jgi:hypothetical protein
LELSNGLARTGPELLGVAGTDFTIASNGAFAIVAFRGTQLVVLLLATAPRELAELDRPRVRPMAPATQRKLLTEKLAGWKELLRANAPKARQMLRKLIDGRIVFNPDTSKRCYRFVANGTMSQLLSGLVYPQCMASPRGIADGACLPVEGFADLRDAA